MLILKNPHSDRRLYVTSYSFFWALLAGPLYYVAHGLWLQTALYVLLLAATAVLVPPLVLALWVGYAVAVTPLLRSHYTARGWVVERAA